MQIIYTAKGSNKSWEWLSMVTICIFMLRDVMRKVQRMYDIPSHGTRHTNPNEKEELKRLMEYLAEDKLQEFKRNFKSERRQAKFAGGGDAGAPSDVEAVALVGDEEHIKDGEEDDDSESVEGGVTREENDLGSFGVVEEDLGVGDDEFSDPDTLFAPNRSFALATTSTD